MHVRDEYKLPSDNPWVRMQSYTTENGALPEDGETAKCVVDELMKRFAEVQQCRIELDFSGVNQVSNAFLELLYTRAHCAYPDIWLIPRHYHPRIRSHLHEHLYEIQRQRTEVWRIASEL